MNDAADSLATTAARRLQHGSSGDYFTFAITGAVG